MGAAHVRYRKTILETERAEVGRGGDFNRCRFICFRILCELYASWVQLINKIRKEGEVYQTVNQQKQKVWKKHPGVAIREDIEKRLIQYFAQFGMVPSGRSRIASPPEIPGDDEDLI